MSPDSSSPFPPRPRPSPGLSLVLFIVIAGGMAFVRMVVFGDEMIALGYGWPLLVCLWHRDRRLLWSLTAAFFGIIAYKSFVLLGDQVSLNNFMHAFNTLVVAGVVHGFIGIFVRL